MAINGVQFDLLLMAINGISCFSLLMLVNGVLLMANNENSYY